MHKLRFVLAVAILAAGLLFADLGPAAAQEGIHHEVRPGETLLGIALQYGTTVEALMKANDLADPDYLREGQTLVIIGPGAGDTQERSAINPGHEAEGAAPQFVHQVVAGDTLLAIALRYGVPMEPIIAANDLSNPDYLSIGMRLTISEGASPSSSTRSSIYIVLPNDNLWSIAQEVGVPLDVLVQVNDLEDGNYLQVGQELLIPQMADEVVQVRLSSEAGAANVSPDGSARERGQRIAEIARSLLGLPYEWGGTGPYGFDCSGFVQYVLGQVGLQVPHEAEGIYQAVKAIPLEELAPGDLVFFVNTYRQGLSHVGIYIGDGQFIHGPYAGTKVRVESLSNPYYRDRLYASGRL